MVFPRTESNSTEELPANIAYFGVRLAPARARHSSVARNLWGQQIKLIYPQIKELTDTK